MWTRVVTVLSTVLLCAALGVTEPATAAPPRVSAVDLPVPAGSEGFANDLNESGQVAGTVVVDGVRRAVRWDGLTRVDLLQGEHSDAGTEGTVINASGTVAGVNLGPAGLVGAWGQLWLPGGMLRECILSAYYGRAVALNNRDQGVFFYTIPSGPGSYGTRRCDADGTEGAGPGTAHAIDDQGRIAGGSFVYAPDTPNPYRYEAQIVQAGQPLVTLPVPAGTPAAAYDFGPAGTVVGATGYLSSPPFQGVQFNPTMTVAWIRGRLIELGTLGGTTSAPLGNGRGVNRIGDVTGTSTTAAGQTHGFRWRLGRMTDLGTLGGPTSTPTAINDRGQIVGESTTASGQTHAFLWSGGQLIDLGAPGGTASTATGINNKGQIIGTVTRADGTHPVRWTVTT